MLLNKKKLYLKYFLKIYPKKKKISTYYPRNACSLTNSTNKSMISKAFPLKRKILLFK